MIEQVLYNAEYDGELFELEHDNPKKANEYMQEWWADRQSDNGLRNGEIAEDEYFILAFVYDEEGEAQELNRIKDFLSYEEYHGDLKEHGYWGI